MPRCVPKAAYIIRRLKQMLTARFFFMVSCMSFVVSLVWLQLVTQQYQPAVNESLIQEALKNVARDFRYSDVYRKTSKLPKDLKYILLWTRKDFAPFYYFEEGQKGFLKHNCSNVNCYVTSDRKFFGDDTLKFDAIAFNGRNMKHTDLPRNRSTHQKFIFFNMESSDNYPVCKKVFDGYFNWTSTYKLNSDIPFPYLMIKDNNGEVVGPKIDMEWIDDMPKLEDELFDEKIANKSKAAAWFVSHCSSRSKRKALVTGLQRALSYYGHTIDVYGKCGPLKCSRDKKSDCDLLLERDYFFYMSLENSFAEDYVTEKLLTALQHYVVPIIYGGANYSRFLPPGSYLDAKKHSFHELAAEMDRIMSTPSLYRQYFRWKDQYTYSDPSLVENVCAVCAALNNKELVETTTVYDEFRKWWHPNYTKRC